MLLLCHFDTKDELESQKKQVRSKLNEKTRENEIDKAKHLLGRGKKVRTRRREDKSELQSLRAKVRTWCSSVLLKSQEIHSKVTRK